jgi:gliding motility-associated-like protein
MGSWTVNPVTNCLEYTAGSYEGNDTLCITICDNRRQCNSTTVIITILGLPPLALDDCVEELDMNMSKTINVTLNDSDIDHDTIVINSIVQEPKFGIASYTQNGNITYTPNRNFCGRDTLYYEICDNDDGCDTAMLCLHIKCECILPQAITPNNDGFNDYLFFPCITGVDNVRLLVWHRWGLIIYENFNYKNDWQGMLKGELLPAGTYWYSIEYTDPETNEQVKEVNYFMIIN